MNKFSFVGCIVSLCALALFNPFGMVSFVGIVLSFAGLINRKEGERGKPIAILGIVLGFVALIYTVVVLSEVM